MILNCYQFEFNQLVSSCVLSLEFLLISKTYCSRFHLKVSVATASRCNVMTVLPILTYLEVGGVEESPDGSESGSPLVEPLPNHRLGHAQTHASCSSSCCLLLPEVQFHLLRPLLHTVCSRCPCLVWRPLEGRHVAPTSPTAPTTPTPSTARGPLLLLLSVRPPLLTGTSNLTARRAEQGWSSQHSGATNLKLPGTDFELSVGIYD